MYGVPGFGSRELVLQHCLLTYLSVGVLLELGMRFDRPVAKTLLLHK